MKHEEPPFEVSDRSVCDQSPVMAGCQGKVKISERGNPDYAWYYITNDSDKDATVTIQKRWIYNNECRTATQQVKLYPQEDREVFSFPRNQRPTCSILSCSLS